MNHFLPMIRHPAPARHDVTGSTLELSGSVEDAAAWVLGALAHLVELDAPRSRAEAQAALPAMCRLLRWGEGPAGETGIIGMGLWVMNVYATIYIYIPWYTDSYIWLIMCDVFLKWHVNNNRWKNDKNGFKDAVSCFFVLCYLCSFHFRIELA